jgi:aquaporin Z
MGQTVRFHETLRRLAMIDETFVEDEARVGIDLSPAAALDAKTAALLQVGVSVAIGSPEVCLEWCTGRALAAGASEDEIADVLLAIAPVAGLGRIVAAAPGMATALGMADRSVTMANVTTDTDADHAAAAGRRYLIRFEEDTLRQRPLWIRLIIEFLGTFVLVTVAAGSGVINQYVGGGPISRTAAVIAPGAVVMAMIYAWGPLSGLHINPAVTVAFASRRVFPAAWVVPYWVVQFAGAICAALFLQVMFGDVAAGGNYPIAKPGGDWRSLVMETVLTAILVSVILNTATGARSIGHNAAIAVGSTVALLGLFASPISGASMNPARTLGPDIVSTDFTGWWVYIAGPVIGAAIAVAIITAVRGLPVAEEREAAQGGALPILGSPSGNSH